ncbi:MAG: response regulator [Myxococcales bacterium]|nr:response regulator [Myxococcales bacterium]MDD9970218.1 response regulator [Myxococcales bacterium]
MVEEDGRVVLVDDEEMVLSSLSSFLTLETAYEIMTFTSARKALDFLDENEADVVVSDFLMPEMDGLAFLSRVRDIRPDVPRIILTGYADKENAIKAINDIGLFQYVEKPWNNDDLRLVLRNATERQRLVRKLNGKIAQINDAYSELQTIQQDILKAFV